jgi:hypothetical protein
MSVILANTRPARASKNAKKGVIRLDVEETIQGCLFVDDGVGIRLIR